MPSQERRASLALNGARSRPASRPSRQARGAMAGMGLTYGAPLAPRRQTNASPRT